jgi:DNA invertase Pin-like site-specific DNA recombinase
MKNAITLIRFGRKKEADQLEKSLKSYAELTGYKVVWHERMHIITPKKPIDEVIINILNNLNLQDIKVDAIIVVRYDHIRRKFTQTAKLIKELSYCGVRVISVEETVGENDPIFNQIYYPIK